jgi:DNA-directed RNA polymerase specialized sigma24 family protein
MRSEPSRAIWSRPSGSASWNAWRPTARPATRRTRRTARHERPYESGAEPADTDDRIPEQLVLTAARHRALHEAVRKLPGRCPRLMEALLSPEDLTYREIAGELGISQGSLGPERSRCLGCLRRLLTPEVAAR